MSLLTLQLHNSVVFCGVFFVFNSTAASRSWFQWDFTAKKNHNSGSNRSGRDQRAILAQFDSIRESQVRLAVDHIAMETLWGDGDGDGDDDGDIISISYGLSYAC